MRNIGPLRRYGAVEKISARDWTFEVDTDGTPTWVEIGGITNFTPASTKNDTDSTDFDSDGWLEHRTMSRSAQLTLEGFRKEDPADGSRDAGQERCEALALLVGAASVGDFQVTSPGGTTYTFSGTVDVNVFETEGGGNDDFSGWQAVISMTGEVTKA